MISARTVVTSAAAVALALVGLGAQTVVGQSNSTCAYNGFDLSSLTTQDWTGTDSSNIFTYSAHVCGPVVTPALECVDGSGTIAAACQKQTNPPGPSFIVGFWENPQWQMIENGVQYTINGAPTCKPNGFAQQYVSTFQFVCSSTQDTQFSVTVDICQQTWILNTPLACVNPPPPPPQPSTSCGYGGIDLTNLTTRDWPGFDGMQVYSYYAHVCGPVGNGDQCEFGNVVGAACQQQINPMGPTYVAGFWSNPVWGLTSNGVAYTLQGANQCRTPNGGLRPYTAMFKFNCAQTQDEQFAVSYDGCNQVWVMNTPEACGPPAPIVPGCRFGEIDLSSLAGYDWTGTDGGSVYSYNAHVCGPVQNVSQCEFDNVVGAACQQQTNPAGQTYIAGFWENPQWETIDNGVAYTINGAPTCKPNGFAQQYVSTFQFLCAPSQDTQFTVVTQICKQVWTMHTPAACLSNSRSPKKHDRVRRRLAPKPIALY